MLGKRTASMSRICTAQLLIIMSSSFAATRIFVAAKPHVVQRFTEMVILDRVREDIHETKKLNVHLFNCLKRALYKPAGFFKG